MSKLLRGFACSLGAALVLGMCASVYADLITYTTLTPYNPGTTASYGSGAGDYQSRADSFGTPSNDLLGAVTGQGGGTSGRTPVQIGLGEIITPQTGSTYGVPNNHGMTVNSLTMPLAGSGAASVTLSIVAGQLQDGSGNPIAPNSPNSAGPPAITATWVPGATVYTNSFSWAAQTNAVLARFDLAAANAADSVNNPAVPTLTLDQSYAVELQWAWASGTDTNDVVWYRGGQVDPGGQILIQLNSTSGMQTFATAGFGAGAPRTAALAINAPAAVPEPGTLVLLGLAVPAFGWAARRRK